MRVAGVSVALALCGAAAGGIYKWIDDGGRTHYGDAPPTAGANRLRGLTNAEAVDLRWYPVTGTDAKAMWRAIGANGPRRDDGKFFAARTDWNLGYRYQTRVLDGQCRVTDVTTRLAVVMRLPRWDDEADAPPDLRQRWQRYLEALRLHEEGHRDNGVAATSEVQAKLGVLPPRPDCGGFDAEARNVASEIVARYVERDREYDRVTEHGRTQGARFP